MAPTKREPLQRKWSSFEAEEPTHAPTIWLCPHISNTLELARTLFLYKPPDAKHGYSERIKPCGDACNSKIDTGLMHSLTEPPALTIVNIIHLCEIEGVRDSVKTLNSRETADYLHTAISNLPLPPCKHLCVSDLLVGKILPLPKEVFNNGKRFPCQCTDGHPWPPRFRHSLSCRVYTVCQACHAEGSYTAAALLALKKGKDDAAKLSFKLDVWRELGCAMDESEPGWKCRALSSSILADALENWVRWMQIKDEYSQWKISSEAPTSTGLEFLAAVRKFLGISTNRY